MFLNIKAVKCDMCGMDVKVIGSDATVAKVSHLARSRGWSISAAGHFCPRHRPQPQDLRWHRLPEGGGLYAPTHAGEYRVVNCEHGYRVATPLPHDNLQTVALNQRMAKNAAQAHFNQHFARRI